MDIAWHDGSLRSSPRERLEGTEPASPPRSLRSSPRERLEGTEPASPPRSLRSSPRERLEGTDAELRAHLHRWSEGVPATTGRHCPACGSDAHGRPWARLADGRTPHVSLSRCGEHLVTVVAEHPVGIDVESVAAVDARWDPTLVLHPDERADRPRERALAWARKEAVLKALGTGLRTPMSRIRVADWAHVDVTAPAGCVASVVVIPGPSGR
ncbi:4'-phosphopantetheinyl transferase family protein [Janibacter hoylei]|uniref:4'-phosphopantetheinyl transferase family protein n=1 Tax=Janibacter hoylei TaxID=364298 RepID=UPI0021A31082|nr:4'-phosphopantetheinyl transferase superfamily protein [Janibacter hoylei]MCT1620099.1 4'-phosphopantetheinyl transferase superfamily protein [Janibacter hoylei]MCT2291603.1 4'-phosphopantetheinyl transferase superfamily protein [Janibacter hoylei]